jgi:hypothetical protein
MISYFLVRAGTIRCYSRAVAYAKAAFDDIDRSLSEDNLQATGPPVSCAAMVAQKMGASELQRVMAADLAGGIGLSGGACGALRAAIWITGINRLQRQGPTLDHKNRETETEDVMDRFLTCTNSVFEGRQIVGRPFEHIGDHAAYVGAGGCSKFIDALAAALPANR